MNNEPSCPVVDQCGGCPRWLSTPDQRRDQLVQQVERALRRAPDHTLLCSSPVGWRHRLTLRPDAEGRAGLSRAGSHDVVAHPLLDRALRSLPPLPGPAELELRTDGTRVVLVIRSRSGHGKKRRGNPPTREALRAIPESVVDGVVIDGHTWRGSASLQFDVDGHALRVSAASFFQVNPEMNNALIGWLRPRLAALAPTRLLDLYAGIGNLGLTLADTTGGVTLIESSRSAVEDARHNARALQIAVPVDIRRGDAHAFRAGDAFFDVALLDPPRRGAGKMIAELAVTRPRAIIYVACDPRSLARDAGLLERSGRYRMAELAVLEMFPWSEHMETVAIFTPNGQPIHAS